jgi:poly(3-hydroxybutyrate) depolymerase
LAVPLKQGWKPLRGFLIACAVALTPACDPKAAELPPLGADLSQTSVSGLSSGGYMAGQFNVAHSATVVGAGIVAAGPFGCAHSPAGEAIPYEPVAAAYNLAQAENGCMANRLAGFGVLDSTRLVRLASALAADGKIDPLADLRRSKLYLYSGTDDNVVDTAVVKASRDFYRAAGVPSENIELVTNRPGGHAFLTNAAGAACGSSASPYVDNCGYDQAEAILRWIYGPLAQKGTALPENFQLFKQGAYASPEATLAPEGTLYVPSACRTAKSCRVHVVFHGCKQSRAEVGDAFIHGSGFADWAETNRIVVLFPQAARSPLNPNSCWDWWGYTARDYLSKDAPQIRGIFAMLTRMGQKPGR